ncbi:MAG: helix-turn-helix transcriptional regulator [Cypionkella sp.]
MRRTDRLFDVIQILRDGRLHRASEMAERLDVSVRTIWRDINTLMASGLPVEGERGVGYILRAPITLPPMILSALELTALREGLRQAATGPDATLARAARTLARRIAAVTPAPLTDPEALFGTARKSDNRPPKHLPLLRRAIKTRERVTLSYIDPRGFESHTDVCPLALDREGRVATLAAYIETRASFRAFRLDRIIAVALTGERFNLGAGQTLSDYRAAQVLPPAPDSIT